MDALHAYMVNQQEAGAPMPTWWCMICAYPNIGDPCSAETICACCSTHAIRHGTQSLSEVASAMEATGHHPRSADPLPAAADA